MTLFLARIRLWALSWRSAPWASERSAGGRGPAAHLPGEQTPTPARRQNWDKTAVLVLGASLHQSLFSTRGLETTVPQAVPRDHCPRAKEVILLPRACPTVTIPISLTPQHSTDGVPSPEGTQPRARVPQMGALSPDPGLAEGSHSPSAWQRHADSGPCPDTERPRGGRSQGRTLDHLDTSRPMHTSGRRWPAPRATVSMQTTGGQPRAPRKCRGQGRTWLRPRRARARARRPPRTEDKVRSRRPRGSALGTGCRGEAGGACPCSRPRPDFGLGLPRPPRSLTIVVDPGRLQELHCSAAAAGLRREPRPSARPGHGAAAAASSRAARPPAAARPARSAPPRHRQPAPRAAATVASCARPPPPPPPPHPLCRSSSGGSRATPEVTARTCQSAPAGNRSPRGRGLRASPRAGAREGGSASGPSRARPPTRGGSAGAAAGERGPRAAARAGRAGRGDGAVNGLSPALPRWFGVRLTSFRHSSTRVHWASRERPATCRRGDAATVGRLRPRARTNAELRASHGRAEGRPRQARLRRLGVVFRDVDTWRGTPSQLLWPHCGILALVGTKANQLGRRPAGLCPLPRRAGDGGGGGPSGRKAPTRREVRGARGVPVRRRDVQGGARRGRGQAQPSPPCPERGSAER